MPCCGDAGCAPPATKLDPNEWDGMACEEKKEEDTKKEEPKKTKKKKTEESGRGRLKQKAQQKYGEGNPEDRQIYPRDQEEKPDSDWEDEVNFWKEEAKGNRAKYSFWLMIMMALPMMVSLLPIYDFVSAKMEEHDVAHYVGVRFGVTDSYEEQVRELYEKHAPWKMENQTEFNGHVWGLMNRWSGKERKLLKRLHRKYVMLIEDEKAPRKKKKPSKDDMFYQYQQRKQAKKDRQRRLVNEQRRGGARKRTRAEREQDRRAELDEEAKKHIPQAASSTNEQVHEADDAGQEVIDLDDETKTEL